MQTKVVGLSGKWADLSSTGHPLSAYQALQSGGYVGVILDLQTPGWQTDYNNALTAGLGVMLNQGYYAPAWRDPVRATDRAQYAAQQMRSVQYPLSATIFLDCEAMDPLSTVAALAWMNAWDRELHGLGYTGLGKYVGANCPLTGLQWYQGLPLTAHYYKSASTVPTVAVRGYQVVQTRMTHLFDGVPIDDDEAGTDRLGGRALAVVAANAVPAPVVTTTTDWKPAIDALQKQVVALQTQNHALVAQIQNAGKALQG